MGIKDARFLIRVLYLIASSLSMPYALCPMPYALCPMPYALCPMPYAPCPMPHALFLNYDFS
ncbi:hypothetical protein [[Scytonema hofmanni] UTEX B 1581]|uniref:hypothetical protein n=1 Tax=[Scytonema hofmanni] UTEX B 1581 TaxID=379535 RepID=UPI001641BEDF|nr:hypothetical protein [[Scytonema hofmanni] UTEX B 1581]